MTAYIFHGKDLGRKQNKLNVVIKVEVEMPLPSYFKYFTGYCSIEN